MTSTSTPDACRAEFEAWYMAANPTHDLKSDGDGGYWKPAADVLWIGWQNAWNRRIAPAAGTPELPPLPDEREAFEAHIRSLDPKRLFILRWPDGTYKHLETQEMWRGWQARAAVALNSTEPAEIAALRRKRDALQAKIDALMLEYCPDEMTPQQIANWASHQTPTTIAAALAAQGEQREKS